MEYALKGDIEVAINHYASLNNNIVSRVANTQKARNINIIKAQLAKRLFSYFKTWHANTNDFSGSLNTRVKDLILRHYRGK